MMWLHNIDVAIFRFINQTIAHPVLDTLLPFFSGNSLFVPAVIFLAAALIWKGGRRGCVFVVMLALVLTIGDGLLVSMLKDLVGRPRPFVDLTDARLLSGKGGSFSMPSSHASTWAIISMVTFIYYRRVIWLVVPVALLVGLSRIYVGVHYPSDVLAGLAIGAGYAVVGLWMLNALWRWVGSRWFPIWHRALPSLVNPEEGESSPKDSRFETPEREGGASPSAAALSMRQSKAGEDAGAPVHDAKTGAPPAPDRAVASARERDRQYLRLGYFLIAALFVFRLSYIAGDSIQLSEDEAYQWVWSKHPALSYYSKPPGIAWIQQAGNWVGGDTEFGVRFFSPVFAALLSVLVLRFMAREAGAGAALLLLLCLTAAPLMGAGAVLMTIDPPLVLCWTWAMIAGWRAVQSDGTTRQWLTVGFALGLGFLCKYTALWQLLAWALFFVLWRPARVHLKRPGPYLALLAIAVCALPVLIWNAQHGWITVTHVGANAGLQKAWTPTLRFFGEFTASEFGLLNPVFFVGALIASVALWKQWRQRPLWVYLFCMGSLLFAGHWIWSLRSRVFPNWIAPAVIPMFCLMVVYWKEQWSTHARRLKPALVIGLVLGFTVVVVMHESKLLEKITRRSLPAHLDPLRRVRAWKETAEVIAAVRQKSLQEGKPVFIVCDHYGLTSLLSFYLPEARTNLVRQPLVYPKTPTRPANQYYFWPEYQYRQTRPGENAIYVREWKTTRPVKGWQWDWLMGKPIGYTTNQPPANPVPPILREEFAEIQDLGTYEIKYRNRVFHGVHLFECRNLR